MSAISTVAKNSPKVQLPPTPTSGERFSDGTFLELILDSRATSKPKILRWQDGRSAVALEHEYGGQRYFVSEGAAGIRHLPSRPLSYRSTEKLFKSVREFISQALGPSAEDLSYLLGFFAFASFFCDCLNMAPCLLLWTPSVLDGIAALRTLACVCFHPVLLATGPLTSWAPELQPITRLVCQPDSSLDMLLAGLQFQGFGIAGKGLRQISGATAVLVGDAELKTPFADSCHFISLPPLVRTFSTDDEEGQKNTIEGIQNRLLMYRLKNFLEVQRAQFDAPDLTGTTREWARILAKCIVDAPDLQHRIVDLLRPRNDADQVQATTRLESVIVEALIVTCHERKSSVHVGDITKLANKILSRDGECFRMKPKEVGSKLRRLGFPTTRLDSAGRGVLLLKNTCARIHERGRAFGVPTLREPLTGCPYCSQS